MPSSDAERQQQGRIWRLGLAAAGAPVSRRVGMGHVEALDQNDLKSGALGRWRSLDRFKISADFLKRAFKPPPRAQRVSHAWCQLGLSCDSAQLTLAYRRHPYRPRPRASSRQRYQGRGHRKSRLGRSVGRNRPVPQSVWRDIWPQPVGEISGGGCAPHPLALSSDLSTASFATATT
jgi:hypothetical protein